MNKKEYVDLISAKTGLTKKDVETVLSTFFEEVCNTLCQGDKCVISNFGTLEVSRPEPHDIFSPHDGKTLSSVREVRFKFKASANLKDMIREGDE